MADRKYIGRKFGAIHRSRELAVQFLYSVDVCPVENVSESLELFLSLDDVAQDDKPEVKARCRELVRHVRENADEIDAVLLRVVTGWRPERMVSVDRAILRLMVMEGFILKSLPMRSAISEARTLAGDFGTDNSARFVNGVMHKAAKYFGEEGDSKDDGSVQESREEGRKTDTESDS